MSADRERIKQAIGPMLETFGFREVLDALAELARETGDAELFGEPRIVRIAYMLERELIRLARKAEF